LSLKYCHFWEIFIKKRVKSNYWAILLNFAEIKDVLSGTLKLFWAGQKL